MASQIGTRHPWAEIETALFGIGTALVLAEFALILYLKDAYWSEEGRLSVDAVVDAVVVGAAVCGLLLLGAAPFGVNDTSVDGEAGPSRIPVGAVPLPGRRPQGGTRAGPGGARGLATTPAHQGVRRHRGRPSAS